jgi:hypothetical protein
MAPKHVKDHEKDSEDEATKTKHKSSVKRTKNPSDKDGSPAVKKPRAKKQGSDPIVDELGWTCIPPSLICK